MNRGDPGTTQSLAEKSQNSRLGFDAVDSLATHVLPEIKSQFGSVTDPRVIAVPWEESRAAEKQHKQFPSDVTLRNLSSEQRISNRARDVTSSEHSAIQCVDVRKHGSMDKFSSIQAHSAGDNDRPAETMATNTINESPRFEKNLHGNGMTLTEAPLHTGASHSSSNKPAKDRDKKSILSQALQRANAAVEMDNAQNYEDATAAYEEACEYLSRVMHKTSNEEDRRKLRAIVSAEMCGHKLLS